MSLITIGGYGFDELQFITALRTAGVDTFVDVRQRRGLRGRRYSFLNSTRLQAILAAAGIRYLHVRELAPNASVREVQKKHDTRTGTQKRVRTRLSSEFVEAYKSEVLDNFDCFAFRSMVGRDARVVALFCVEGQPEACHRSVAAERLGKALGVSVHHIRP